MLPAVPAARLHRYWSGGQQPLPRPSGQLWHIPDFPQHMAVKGVIVNPVLGAVVLSKGIVGLAGVNPLGMFCVCVAYRQRLPTLAAFYQSGKQADFIVCPGRWRDFSLFCTISKLMRSISGHAVPPPQSSPPASFPQSCRFETVVLFLGSNCPGVDGIHQKVFDNGEVPHIPPIFRVFLFPFGAGIAKPPFPVPTMWGRGFFLPPAVCGYSWDHDRLRHTRKSAAQSGRFPRQ